MDEEIAGITCADVLAALGDYVDGELAVPTRARIEAHVARCHNCERFGGVFAEVVRGLRAHARATIERDEHAVYARLRAHLERA